MNFNQRLKTLEDARKNATQFDFEETNGMRNSNPDADLIYFLIGPPTLTGAQDAEFIKLAANHIQRLIDDARKMRDAIDQSIARSDDYGDSYCSKPIRDIAKELDREER